MDVPLDELVRRLEVRNGCVGQEPVFRISREDMEQWAEIFQPPSEDELK